MNRRSVQVLLSSYNGEKYIKQQIDSLIDQVGVDVNIYIRDDGSSDLTSDIIKEYSEIRYEAGNNIGPGRSFFSLIDHSDVYPYYALCDQDDIWDRDKLLRAVMKLEKFSEIPALYCSNTRIVNSNGEYIGKENKKPKTSLGSALIKNYATGCTVVFNQKLMNMLRHRTPKNVTCHDWWINLVCLAIGGISIFDSGNHIAYRQHGNNVEGANADMITKMKRRLTKFFKPVHRRCIITQNIIRLYKDDIVKENREILEEVAGRKKIKIFKDRRLRTNNIFNNFLFHICVLFGKE